MFKDTRDVDESVGTIQKLYPRIVALKPKIAEAAEAEDLETYKGITRIFAEAGEAWVVLIARMPGEFLTLVEAVLECCARDWDRDCISLTFIFWYELKQYVTLDKYIQARVQFADIFSQLVDIMIKHLAFPTTSTDSTDPFEGDREQEEKFREFRHAMGDVLKDCCAVIGVTECLGKSFVLIKEWVKTYGSQATSTHVPHWQKLEAPLFSMRAMGRMVSPEESIVLPQVIPLIVQIPNQERIRFQAIMALGRYTEWTAQHPEFLQPQLNYIISGFQHDSEEVLRAAALAFRFFGTDCRKLLKDNATQLHDFYESVIDNLPPASQEELTEGVAAVLSAQPLDKIYEMFKLYCDPLIRRLMSLADNAQDEKGKLALAGMQSRYSMLLSSSELTCHFRLSTASHHIHPMDTALCLAVGRQPRCKVLSRDFPCLVCNCRKFHFIPRDSRTSVSMLAPYGDLVPNSHDPNTAVIGETARFRVRKVEARLLPMGDGLDPPRVFRRSGVC